MSVESVLDDRYALWTEELFDWGYVLEKPPRPVPPNDRGADAPPNRRMPRLTPPDGERCHAPACDDAYTSGRTDST